MGGSFETCQEETSIWTNLAETDHPQPPTIVETDNKAANSIVDGTSKNIISREIDMRFLWVCNRIRQTHFYIFWEEVMKNLVEYFTKHHPIWHHRNIPTRFLEPTKKFIESSKDRRTETGQGCDGTRNTGITRIPDNPLKGIQNIVSRKSDNTLKGIRNIVPNVTRNQCTRGLTVPTYIYIYNRLINR